MSQDFQAGDYLIFQIEAGFGLLRLLSVEDGEKGRTWHISAYEDLYLDIDSADQAIASGKELKVSRPHLALTTRAFESTQTARMGNKELTEKELEALRQWEASDEKEISDLSVRLLLGLR